MDILELSKLSYDRIIECLVEEIGTGIELALEENRAFSEFNGTQYTEVDIDEMIMELIDQWEIDLIKINPLIKETLLFGKMSRDGFKKDILKGIADAFYFDLEEYHTWDGYFSVD